MQRQRLPNRRASTLFDFTSMDMRLTASIRRDAGGNVAELFLDNHKAGSSISSATPRSRSRLPSSMAPIPKRSAARFAATFEAMPAGRSAPRST
jgi:hypothetical protein